MILKTAAEKRAQLREDLQNAKLGGKLLRYCGAFMPLAAMAVEEARFEGIYFSGGAFSASLGLPDIGLTTLSEVTTAVHQIARVTNLPLIVDADTGFGGTTNVVRTVQEFEHAGASGLHLEDQVHPKRCGHLDGKELISTDDMCQKIRAACGARTDKNFLIIARTDARSTEGYDAAIARAKAYIAVGAEMIFAEALASAEEFKNFAAAIAPTPLLANITEFGKTPILNVGDLTAAGARMVIYPVSTLRLAMQAIIDGIHTIHFNGYQTLHIINKMQTREDLYRMIRYQDYVELDQKLAHDLSKK